MKILVLIKEVPDTYGPRTLSLTTGLADRGASETIVDEICERALEVALTQDDSEVIALCMGPATAAASLRGALAMGASSAIHVLDDGLAGSDLGTTARVLATAIERTGFDLVVAGDRSTDGAGGVVPAMVAEFLGVPHATALSSVDIDKGVLAGTRITATATVEVSSPLPAVISITEALPDPRFPTVRGVMAAKKKPVHTMTMADLGISLDDDGRGHSIVIGVSARPPRAAGTKVIDHGDAAEQLVAYLADANLL